MIKTLTHIFTKKKLSEYDLIISEIKRVYKHAPADFGGGCSYQKALAMVVFIKEFNLQISADIGVYRGRSLFPQAIAHKNYNKGIVYGIDPFNNLAAIQNDRPDLKESLDNFVQNTDFNKMYLQVSNIITKHKLKKYCSLIREKSEDAKYFFNKNKLQLGLLHIDGNHDTCFVIRDVNDYLPLIKDGGIVIIDDVSWDSVKPALEIMHNNCEFIGNIIDGQNDFAIFIRNPTCDEMSLSEKIFNVVKNYDYPNG